MTSSPFFSVITASYNSAGTIQALAQSLADQTYRDFEWIVQDGASSDLTVAIAEGTEAANPRVSSARDSGIYDALNRAIDRSRGEYLIFLGGDDRLSDTNVLDDLHRDLSADPVDILLAQTSYPDGSTFVSRLGRITVVVNSVHHQGAAYSRKRIGAFRYDLSSPVVADYELNLIAYREGWTHRSIDRVISICEDDGVSRRGSETALYADLRRLRRKHLGRSVSWAAWLIGLANVARRRVTKARVS